MSKKALVLGSGGLNGAYSAGFVSELCRKLGPNYFDSIYCYSVGATTGTFFVANQPDTIENTWRNYIHGTRLIKPHNFFLGKPMLDLDYLISLFKNDISRLDVNAAISSKIDLNYVLIDYYSGEILCKKPNKDNIFELIKACCSLPIVSGPSRVGDKLFFDAAFVSGGLPLLEKITENHDKVIVVLNMPKDYKPRIIWWPIINLFFPIASYFYPKLLRRVFKKRKDQSQKNLEYAIKNKKVQIIAPTRIILDSGGDSNIKKIQKTIELGKQDTKLFLGR